jgi:hypothetical protein
MRSSVLATSSCSVSRTAHGNRYSPALQYCDDPLLYGLHVWRLGWATDRRSMQKAPLSSERAGLIAFVFRARSLYYQGAPVAAGTRDTEAWSVRAAFSISVRRFQIRSECPHTCISIVCSTASLSYR